MRKFIPGFEGIYSIDDNGTVYSEERKVIMGHGYRIMKESIKKYSTTDDGYYRVDLSKNGKHKQYLVHRLVMLTFVGKSNLQVNHKNGIKTDNYIENLEYCTARENSIHSFKELGRKSSMKGKFGKDNHLSKGVIQKDLDGNFIKEFVSVKEASELVGGQGTPISRCCKGKQKTAYGYLWDYASLGS